MTDPIKKLKKDMQPVLNGCSFEHQHKVLAVLDAFAAEWRAREVRHDPSGPECYWTDMGCDGDPTTILVPRKTVSLLEAAEELCDAVAEILPPASASTRLENAHAAAAEAIKRAGGGE